MYLLFEKYVILYDSKTQTLPQRSAIPFEKYVILYDSKTRINMDIRDKVFEKYVILYDSKTLVLFHLSVILSRKI